MSKSSALRNSFIPKRSPLIITRILQRLTTESLLNLCLLWCSIPLTQPRPTKSQLEDIDQTLIEYIDDFKFKLQNWKSGEYHINKRKIIDYLLVDYYPMGLNLLQYAQIDSQLLVEKPQVFIWQTSSFINNLSKSEIINIIDPQWVLEKLVENLSKFYINHVYISKHPYYPLTIIRIQIFDILYTQPHSQELNITNSLISRKPFFIAIPQNSSNLIHSTTSNQDIIGQMILQSLTTSLSITQSKQIRIDLLHQEHTSLMKSLESLHIIHGNSRFSNSLGVWTPYADGTVDISPFDDPETHQTMKIQEEGKEEEQEEIGNIDERRRKIAMLRFKGSIEGLITERLYEDVKPIKKRKFIIKDQFEENEEIRNIDKNEFSSITPVQFVQFNLKNDYKNVRPCIKLKLSGNDVFGGLHELCSKGVINPELIPGFLTGEEGIQGGDVEDGVFIPNSNSSINEGNGELI